MSRNSLADSGHYLQGEEVPMTGLAGKTTYRPWVSSPCTEKGGTIP
jgi:hypothetical protein